MVGRRKRDLLFVHNSPYDLLRLIHIDRCCGVYIPIKNSGGHVLIRNNGVTLISPISDTCVYSEVRSVYLKPTPGQVVVDAGAHYGFYSVFCSRLVGENGLILAFEPDWVNFKNMKANLRLNNVRNVLALNYALSDANETTKLYLSKRAIGHSIVRMSGKNFVWVPTRKLDSIIDEYRINRLDLIKIDVEGAELLVLKGAIETLTKFKPVITTAAYHSQTQLQEIVQFLSSKTPFYRFELARYPFHYGEYLNCYPAKR